MDVFHSNIEKFCFVLFLSIILFPIFGHTPLFGARHSLLISLEQFDLWFELTFSFFGSFFHDPCYKCLTNLNCLFVVAGTSQTEALS